MNKLKKLLLAIVLVALLAAPAWVADATAVNTTNKGNLNCPYNNEAAQTIRITPDQTPADNSGRVRVTIWYEDSIPPTS